MPTTHRDYSLPDPKQLESYFDRLWPICRSITGKGFRDSLAILSELIPLEVLKFQTGTKVLDWTIPKEWNIADAWIEDASKNRIVDFRKNNLHLVGYSVPVDVTLDLEDLKKHLHTLPEMPDAIPYHTSYYRESWGFCLTHKQLQSLKPGKYRAIVRSTLKEGTLDIGHTILPSTVGSKDEVLISTYLCHPSLANNELSGPLLTSFLYQALSKAKYRRFQYRFVYGPETIGPIAYLSQFGEHLADHTVAGLIISCCGTNRNFTYKNTRHGNALLDRIVKNVLQHQSVPFENEAFNPADGSDERQYCSPGFDLPVGSIMRPMYGKFTEYHTSLDNKSILSFSSMVETLKVYLDVLSALERNHLYVGTVLRGEPMLGPRDLYPPPPSNGKLSDRVANMKWLLNFADGSNDLCAIAERAQCSVLELAEIAEFLCEKNMLTPTA